MSDEEFDFGDFDDDEFDFGGGFGEGESIPDDRSPVTRFGTSFLDSAKKSVINPSYVTDIARKALPEGYDAALDTADDVMTAGSDIYEKARKTLKPAVRNAKRTLRRFIPKLRGALPETFVDKLDNILEDKESSGRKQTEEERRTIAINQELSSIFAAQAEHQAAKDEQDKAEEQVKEHVQNVKTDKALTQGSSTVSLLNRLVSYQDNITIKYQRKLLEIQHHQLYTLRDILNISTNYFTDTKTMFEAIAKNTALPEVTKMQMNESFQEYLRNKMVETSVGTAADYTRNFKKNLINNLKKKAAEKVGSIRDSIDSITTNLDTVASIQEQTAGMGGPPTDNITTAGEMASGTAMGWVAKKLTEIIKKRAEEDEDIMRRSEDLLYTTQNMPGIINRWASEGGMDDNAVQQILRTLIADAIPTYGGEAATIANRLENEALSPVPWDFQSRHTLNEIIPDYLSRILQQTEIIATGDKDREQLVFDTRSEKMVTKSALGAAAAESILSEEDATGFREKFNDLFFKSIDPDYKLNKKARRALMERVIKDADRGINFDPLELLKDNAFDDVTTDDTIAPQIQKVIKDYFKVNDEGEIEKSKTAATRRRSVANQVLSIQRNLPDIQEALDEWQMMGKKEALRDSGFVVHSGGKDRVDYDKYWETLLGRDEIFGPPKPEPLSTGKPPSETPPPPPPPGPTPPPNPPSGSPPDQNNYHPILTRIEELLTKSNANQADHTSSLTKIEERLLSTDEEPSYSPALSRIEEILSEVNDKQKDYTASLDLIEEILFDTNVHRPDYNPLLTKIQETLDQIKETGERQIDECCHQMGYSDSLTTIQDKLSSIKEVISNQTVIVEARNASDQDKSERTINYHEEVKGLLTNLVENNNLTYKLLSNKLRDEVASVNIANVAELSVGQEDNPNSHTNQHLIGINQRLDLATSLMNFHLSTIVQSMADAAEESSVTSYITKGIKGTFDTVTSGIGKVYGGIGSMLGGAANLTRGIGGGFGAFASGVGTGIGNIISGAAGEGTERLFDIYVKGEKKPRLESVKLARGEYSNSQSGKTIFTIADIEEDVVDKDGNVVLSTEDMAKGLVNRRGFSLRLGGALRNLGSGLFGGLGSYYRTAFGVAKSLFKIPATIGKKVGSFLTRNKDAYIAGEATPRIIARVMNAGGYFDHKGNVIKSINDITGDVFDEQGRLVVSLDEMRTGLVDRIGKPLGGSAFSRIIDKVKTASKAIWKGAKTTARVGKNVALAVGRTGAKAGRFVGDRALGALGYVREGVPGLNQLTGLVRNVRAAKMFVYAKQVHLQQSNMGAMPTALSSAIAGKTPEDMFKSVSSAFAKAMPKTDDEDLPEGESIRSKLKSKFKSVLKSASTMLPEGDEESEDGTLKSRFKSAFKSAAKHLPSVEDPWQTDTGDTAEEGDEAKPKSRLQRMAKALSNKVKQFGEEEDTEEEPTTLKSRLKRMARSASKMLPKETEEEITEEDSEPKSRFKRLSDAISKRMPKFDDEEVSDEEDQTVKSKFKSMFKKVSNRLTKSEEDDEKSKISSIKEAIAKIVPKSVSDTLAKAVPEAEVAETDVVAEEVPQSVASAISKAVSKAIPKKLTDYISQKQTVEAANQEEFVDEATGTTGVTSRFGGFTKKMKSFAGKASFDTDDIINVKERIKKSLTNKNSKIVTDYDDLREKVDDREDLSGYFERSEVTETEQVSKLEELIKLISDRIPKKKKVVGDTDGDGLRENSWQDIMKDREEAAKEGAQIVASPDQPTKAGEKKGWKGGGLTAALAAGGGIMGSIADTVTTAVGGALSWAGLKKVFGKKPPVPTAPPAPATTTARTAVQTGARVVASHGMRASAVLAAKTALGAIGGVLSLPVVLGTAAVAGVGYAGWKLSGYFTRRSAIEPLEGLRFLSYGIALENKKHIIAIRYLEDELIGEVDWDDSEPTMDIEPEDVVLDYAEEFGVNMDMPEQVQNFALWYKRRFLPVFLTHLRAARTVDDDVDLLDIDDEMDDDDKPEFIKAIRFDRPDSPNVFGVEYSPFPGLSVITNRDVFDGQCDKLIKEYGGALDKPSGALKKAGDQLISSSSALAATSVAAVQKPATMGAGVALTKAANQPLSGPQQVVRQVASVGGSVAAVTNVAGPSAAIQKVTGLTPTANRAVEQTVTARQAAMVQASSDASLASMVEQQGHTNQILLSSHGVLTTISNSILEVLVKLDERHEGEASTEVERKRRIEAMRTKMENKPAPKRQMPVPPITVN